jgi:hypothetical protein
VSGGWAPGRRPPWKSRVTTRRARATQVFRIGIERGVALDRPGYGSAAARAAMVPPPWESPGSTGTGNFSRLEQ